MKNNPRSIHLAGDFFMAETKTPQVSNLASELQRANRTLIESLDHGLSSGTQLHAALHHHFSAGGGRVRMALALDSGRRLGLSEKNRLRLALATELIHNASLIHDDLQDQDPTRRGKPAVWVTYGTDVAILAGDYLLASAFGQLGHCTQEVPALIQHFQKRTSDLIFGQALDLASGDAKESFSLQRYRQIVSAKSGALLSMPLELTLLASGQDMYLPAAQNAGEAFAVAYQISDDLTDIQADARHDCLNVVHALLQLGQETALHVAITEGQVQCQQAIDLADTLPNGCAKLMAEKAKQLLMHFNQLEETHTP
ncbi:MAG TPA: polyprenyl synthetase family protein [Wenzhouxiangella sp.]